MKSFIVLALCVAVAVALPLDDSKNAQIVRFNVDNIGVEGYSFESETSDGKSASEQGQLQNIGTENEALEVQGQFSYIGDDGLTYTVRYTSGVNGFVPEGAHIPKAA